MIRQKGYFFFFLNLTCVIWNSVLKTNAAKQISPPTKLTPFPSTARYACVTGAPQRGTNHTVFDALSGAVTVGRESLTVQ